MNEKYESNDCITSNGVWDQGYWGTSLSCCQARPCDVFLANQWSDRKIYMLFFITLISNHINHVLKIIIYRLLSLILLLIWISTFITFIILHDRIFYYRYRNYSPVAIPNNTDSSGWCWWRHRWESPQWHSACSWFSGSPWYCRSFWRGKHRCAERHTRCFFARPARCRETWWPVAGGRCQTARNEEERWAERKFKYVGDCFCTSRCRGTS